MYKKQENIDMRAESKLTAQQSQMVDLGRQARMDGYPTDSCSLPTFDVLRFFWLAGWHDQDAEMRVKNEKSV